MRDIFQRLHFCGLSLPRIYRVYKNRRAATPVEKYVEIA